MRQLRPWLTVLAFGVLTACGSGPLQQTQPGLAYKPTSLDFGAQPVLTKVTRTIHLDSTGRRTLVFSAQITNAMATPLDVTSSDDAGMPADDAGTADAGDLDAGTTTDAGDTDAGMTADAGDADAGSPADGGSTIGGPLDPNVFTLSYPDGASMTQLAAGEGLDITVTFLAAQQGSYSADVVLTSNDPKNMMPPPIHLTAQATTAAGIKIDPSGCVDFGQVPEGQSLVRQVTLTSVGTAPLQIQQMSITGMSSAAFEVLGSTAGGSIDVTNPPTSLPINLKFQPQSTFPNTNGEFNADLQFATNDPGDRLVDICLKGQMVKLPIAVEKVIVPASGSTMVIPGTTVTVDGSGSSDPGGLTPLTYQWTLASVPSASTAALTAPADTQPQVSFTMDQPGEYDLELVVTNTAGIQSKPALLRLIAATADDLQVELVWDTPTGDLDLHMYPPDLMGSGLFTPFDCYGYNPTPMNWGGMTYPVDSGDKLSGFGPEIIDYKTPVDQRYQITVIYNSTQGVMNPALNATVRIYFFGSIRSEFTKMMTTMGEQWDAAWIDWKTMTVTAGTAPKMMSGSSP